MSFDQTNTAVKGNKQKKHSGYYLRGGYAKNVRSKPTLPVMDNVGGIHNISATGAAQFVKSGSAPNARANFEGRSEKANASMSPASVAQVPTLDLSAIVNVQQLGAKVMIEKLIGDYKSFENYHDTQVKTIKQQLYTWLANVYAVYAEMKKTGTYAQQLCEELDKYLLEAGLTIGAKAKLLSKILVCVFGKKDTKKTHGYYTVIKFAEMQGRKPEELVEFINAYGGIQKIREAMHAKNKATKISGQPAALTRDQKIAKARGEIITNKTCVIDDPELEQLIPSGNVAKQILLVATPMPDGTVVINAAVADADVVEKALLAYATAKAKAEKNTAEPAGGEKSEDGAAEPSMDILADMEEAMA